MVHLQQGHRVPGKTATCVPVLSHFSSCVWQLLLQIELLPFGYWIAFRNATVVPWRNASSNGWRGLTMMCLRWKFVSARLVVQNRFRCRLCYQCHSRWIGMLKLSGIGGVVECCVLANAKAFEREPPSEPS